MAKSDDIKEILNDLKEQRRLLEKREKDIENREKELRDLLAKASKMTIDDAKKHLLSEVEKELKSEIAQKIRLAEEKIKIESNKKAQEIIITAMKNGATTYTADYTVSVVTVPNEDVKGRIIG